VANQIIWAFNPFQKNKKVFRNTVAFLKSLSQDGDKVEPVFVVSPAEAKVVLEFSVPARIRFQTVARRASLRVLNQVRFRGLLPPKILVENHLQISYSAKSLAAYASKVNAKTIVVGTQAKEGLQRLLLGSFAETLLGYAKTPLVFINPHIHRIAPLENILFATDFSEASFRAFKSICEIAKDHGARILLFHCLPKPFLWAKQAAEFLFGRGMMSVGEYLSIEAQNRAKTARPFVKFAGTSGIPIQVEVEQNQRETSDAILARATKSKVNMIALATQSDPIRQTLLGSTTRGVLREAHVPVWAMPPNKSPRRL